jgi:nucleoside-diphosphate-sugar epimerase
VSVVVVSGVAGAVGRRLLTLLDADDDVTRVVGIDRRPAGDGGPKLEAHLADLVTDPLGPLLAGADVVVHLAHDLEADGTGVAHRAPPPSTNAEATGRLLAAAAAAGVRRAVVVSSATVYGAWPSNPVPITEAAAVRPNPGFGYAAQKAEVERRCVEWRAAHDGAAVAVLRPAPTVDDGGLRGMARWRWVALRLRAGDDPPAQFLHVDDLAAAVDVARRAGLDGAYNVAPDGWVDGEQVRALAGAPPRVPVPAPLARRLAGWSWRLRVGAAPPGVLPYTLHPWVVANDRLRGAGWAPTTSNEEAFVGAHAGTPWSRLSPRRRQELALGVAGTALVAGAAGVALGVRALRRRRR